MNRFIDKKCLLVHYTKYINLVAYLWFLQCDCIVCCGLNMIYEIRFNTFRSHNCLAEKLNTANLIIGIA